MKLTFKSWIIEKLILVALSFGFFYILGNQFGFVSPETKDAVNSISSWFATNLPMLLTSTCILSIVWLVNKFMKRGDSGGD